jgi:hypothetical protein
MGDQQLTGEAPEDDAAHPFVIPDNPAEREAAKRDYDEAMHKRIIDRLSKTPVSKRRRWRPASNPRLPAAAGRAGQAGERRKLPRTLVSGPTGKTPSTEYSEINFSLSSGIDTMPELRHSPGTLTMTERRSTLRETISPSTPPMDRTLSPSFIFMWRILTARKWNR